MRLDHGTVVRDIQFWLERVVIGLNLCPFAKSVHVHDQIHYVVSAASEGQTLMAELEQELLDLRDRDPQIRETTLLIAPKTLTRFQEMLEFLDQADHLLDRIGLVGVIQIASFHPQYQFAGTATDDIENFTNRAPYPVLHLLREESVDRAVAAFPDARSIYEANIATMRALGHDGWCRLLKGSQHGG